MPRKSPATLPLAIRLARGSRLDPASGCIVWTRALTKRGYGKIGVGQEVCQAHRVAWEACFGPVPAGLVLDHLCRNHACINPAHLEPVTQRENVLRGESFAAENAAKTHCQHGHEFSPENTYSRPDGGRQCRACNREAARAFKQRKNAA